VVATAYTTQVERREVLYEMQIREVLEDGVVTDEERIKLEELKAKLGMSDEKVEAIARQVREEKGLA
jgi:voltage-gated potassium channel